MSIRWQTPYTSDTNSPCTAHAFNITIAKIPQNRTIQTKTITNQQSELSNRVQFTKKTENIINLSNQRIMAPHNVISIIHIM